MTSYLMRTLDRYPVQFASGDGSWLITPEGERYLDWFTDVGTASLGYGCQCTERILMRVMEENIPLHTPNLFGCPERERAAERLCKATGMERAFFCTSGAEAVEGAIKLARLNTHRKRVASVVGSFHGRTYGALAAGDGGKHHYEGFEPLPGMFVHWEPPAMPPADAGIVIIAPIFGNNDVQLYGAWLKRLQRWCQQHHAILIFDEVQTGSCRTSGTMSYSHSIGVLPDILCLAKGVAMGAPVGVTLSRGGLDFTPGSHFSTFGGSPMSAAMVNAMIDWSEKHHQSVGIVGRFIRKRLKEREWAKNVRGEGMLIAFDWEGDCLGLAAAALEERLLIGAFRRGPGPIKITPPLNIASADLKTGFEALDRAAARSRAS